MRLTIFLNKIKKAGGEQLLQYWGVLECFNFLRNTIFSEKLEFNKVKTFLIHCAIMKYLPKLLTHASLILWMLFKMTFTSLFLPTVIIRNLLSLCPCPSKSKEKHCMGKVLDWYNIHFCLYINSSHLTNLYSEKNK